MFDGRPTKCAQVHSKKLSIVFCKCALIRVVPGDLFLLATILVIPPMYFALTGLRYITFLLLNELILHYF